MFGRAPRGISERPKIIIQPKTIPSWLWLVVLVLAGLCVVIFLSLWSPWRPVNSMNHTSVSSHLEKDTNKDYKFYDLLPKQQVMPIPEQAVPAHQLQEAAVVIEAPVKKAMTGSEQTMTDVIEAQDHSGTTPTAPRYILQVRSYEDPDSADARRAEIVLNGLSAEVVVSHEAKKIWYRVISGPYDSQEAAHIAQQTLQNGGIDSIIVKQSGSS